MKVIITIHDEMENRTYEKRLSTENLGITLSETFKKAGVNIADVSSYYPLSEFFYFNTETLPYLISGGEISYNVSYDEAKLGDFFRTHAISNNTIKVVTSMIQASGPDFLTNIESWELVISILGLIGINIKDLVHDIYKHLKNKKVKPQVLCDLFFSNEEISASILANQLDIEKEKAKQLLKGLGYKYDNKRQTYVKSKEAEQIEKALKRNEEKFIKLW